MKYTLSNTIDIGRPVKVYLNGRIVETAIYADDKKGKVVFYRKPIKLNKYRKRILSKTMYGHVVVEVSHG